MVLTDARFGEPPPQLRAGAAAERLTCRELDGTRRLPDDRDAVVDRPRDDRSCPLEVARADAFRARTDSRLKAFEITTAIGPNQANVGL